MSQNSHLHADVTLNAFHPFILMADTSEYNLRELLSLPNKALKLGMICWTSISWRQVGRAQNLTISVRRRTLWLLCFPDVKREGPEIPTTSKYERIPLLRSPMYVNRTHNSFRRIPHWGQSPWLLPFTNAEWPQWIWFFTSWEELQNNPLITKMLHILSN